MLSIKHNCLPHVRNPTQPSVPSPHLWGGTHQFDAVQHRVHSQKSRAAEQTDLKTKLRGQKKGGMVQNYDQVTNKNASKITHTTSHYSSAMTCVSTTVHNKKSTHKCKACKSNSYYSATSASIERRSSCAVHQQYLLIDYCTGLRPLPVKSHFLHKHSYNT